jgi:hypothetical protein
VPVELNVRVVADWSSLKGQVGKVVNMSGELFHVRMPYHFAPIWWRKDELEFTV